MPSQYRRDLPRLKAAIVARVLAGQSLRATCADPAMPRVQTVRNWAAADPGFAAELVDARRRAEWRRRFAFNEGDAAAFLARARAGETVNSLIGAAGMPSRRTYRYWCATDAGFAEAVAALRHQRDAQIGAHGRARFRAFDQGLADRLIVALHRGLPMGFKFEEVLAADPALPSRPVVTRWRRERPEFDRVLRMIFAACRYLHNSGFRVPADLSEAMCDVIVEGGSFASLSRMPQGPARATLRLWHRADPVFAAAVAWACEARDDFLHEQVCEVAERTPPGPIREMNRAVGPLLRQMVRLRHRPGAVHVKREAR